MKALFVLFVVAGYHTLKQGSWLIPQGTGIEVDQQEQREYKTYDKVQCIIKHQRTDIKYGIGDLLREHHCNA